MARTASSVRPSSTNRSAIMSSLETASGVNASMYGGIEILLGTDTKKRGHDLSSWLWLLSCSR